MMKLVFLHGSGSDKNAYHDIMQMMARHWNAELIVFNAPFAHPEKPDKYRWFDKFQNKGRRDAVIDEYTYSLGYIKERLNNLQTNSQNIILVGHSQGGGMAVHVGLEMELAGVVSINGDLPYNLSYQKQTNTPIYWLESRKDDYINANRKASYQLILNNQNFHLLTLENSSHNDFEEDLLKIIRKGEITF